MNRKRWVLLHIIPVLLAGISGCELQIENEFVKSERTKDAIIEALNEKDKYKLRSIFSSDAINDAENYEEGEQYLFSIYSGECEYCEMTSRGSEGHMGKPGRIVSVYTFYLVQFDGQKYKLYLYDYPINKRNKNMKGLYSLALLPIDETENNKEYFADKAGIYYPGWTEEE